jgi:hypothetical protein
MPYKSLVGSGARALEKTKIVKLRSAILPFKITKP